MPIQSAKENGRKEKNPGRPGQNQSRGKSIMAAKKQTKKKQPSFMAEDLVVNEWISSGSVFLDAAASCNKSEKGGFPSRRIIEFSGTGGAGKSYICGEMAGDALRKSYEVYVDDIEQRWDLSRLSTFGFELDTPGFHYIDPSTHIEECFERLSATLVGAKPGSKILYIIDPIAALNSKTEMDGKSDKMGQSRAKALQFGMRMLKDKVNRPDCTFMVVFSNQLIDNVGAGMFEEKKITPGGNALVHWPSVRVRFTQIGKLTDEVKGRKGSDFKEKITRGIKLKAVFKKNSEDDPYRECVISIAQGYGVDNIRDCARYLKKYTNCLGDAAASYEWPVKGKDPIKLQGIGKFVAFVEEKGLEEKLFKKAFLEYKKRNQPIARKIKKRY
jgi:RecA/RadA recombinase